MVGSVRRVGLHPPYLTLTRQGYRVYFLHSLA